jgi:hypothetical protein
MANSYVTGSQTTTAAVPITLTLPAPMPFSAPAAAAFPIFSMNYSDLSASNSVSYSASITWNASDIYYIIDDRTITVTATSVFQNGADTLAIPDLTMLSGFIKPTIAKTGLNGQLQ